MTKNVNNQQKIHKKSKASKPLVSVKLCLPKIKIAVILLFSITAIFCIACLFISSREITYASTQVEPENVSYDVITPLSINLDDIIEENSKQVQKEEIITKTIDLEYTTKYTNNPNLPKGIIQVLQNGDDGTQEIVTKKTYEGEKVIKEEQTGSHITKSSVDKLVQVGTGNAQSSYKVKKGDTLYVTAYFVPVRIKANDEAEKVITLYQNTAVKLLQQKNNWYEIQYQSYQGWAKAECFTYLDPNKPLQEETNTPTTSGKTYTKAQLLSKLSFDMKLNEPSGLSLEQFKKIFKNDPRDKQKIFENNAQYFYYAEQQYNVNGVFIAAVAIHESGWGGSSIASNKKNLFGYGAYDRDPYNNAYQFENYSEGIDLLGRVFAKYYLNKKGTKIYEGNIADGSYYHGATLTGVNTKYATDKNWAKGVYSWMKYLYQRL